ncbi:mucin-1-like isoform X2 [Senna tora]|uniref:Mucin-1-like isoform X2 n=1 Tax=Senna tora TaxID=362788 RepID=A0A834TQ36_9FABA|nr:mucin-1-like isoform X2 [Senna tora]
MDKSWITKSRVSSEYVEGLDKFLDFAFANTITKGLIKCPCIHCGFRRWQTRETVYHHLICTQFPEGYTVWVWHGESAVRDANDTSNIPKGTDIGEGGLSNQDLMQDMVKDAFGFSRNVGVEAHESVDEVESGVHGFHRQYSRDDGDTISLAKEVEEDESSVMHIEASMGRPKRIRVSQGAFFTESVPVPIPIPIPTPSLSTHPPPAPTPPFTSNPTPCPHIPTPSLSTHPPPTPTPPFTSNPTPRPPISTSSLSTHPPPAPTPPSTSNPTPRPPIPTPSLPTHPPPAPTPPFTSDTSNSHGVKREGRLKTNGVWTLPAGQRIVVPFNRQGQPIGEAAGLLSGFLGIIGTDLTTFPISYYSWKLVPCNYKDTAFSNIKAKFCLDNEIAKCFVLKKLGNNWRNYRGWLFHTFYEVQMSREHNLDNHPDFIPYDMWAGFVDYRLNPRTQEMESGGPVSRGAIFVATHKKRDGSFVNDEAKNICEKIIELENQGTISAQISEQDSVGQVLGKEHPGRVRGLGFGPTPTQVFGLSTTRLGRIPLNYSNGDTTNALQQEIVRLQSELESSNARFESSNARLEASNARLEASNAQLKLEMRGVFNILKNIMGNVPSEFAHMINSEVPEASNGQSSSVGHSFSASEDHPNT